MNNVNTVLFKVSFNITSRKCTRLWNDLLSLGVIPTIYLFITVSTQFSYSILIYDQILIIFGNFIDKVSIYMQKRF